MNFKIYKNIFRYRHSLLCEMFDRLGKEAGVSKEVEIHLHDEKHPTLLGTCRSNAVIPIIHIYVDKDRKYPCWLFGKHHPHAVRIKTEFEFINFIVAHELCHITYGNPRNFKWAENKKDLRAMEICCDEFAAKATNVKAFKYGKHYRNIIDSIIVVTAVFAICNLIWILLSIGKGIYILL